MIKGQLRIITISIGDSSKNDKIDSLSSWKFSQKLLVSVAKKHWANKIGLTFLGLQDNMILILEL